MIRVKLPSDNPTTLIGPIGRRAIETGSTHPRDRVIRSLITVLTVAAPRSFSVAQTLIGVGNSVHHVSSTCVSACTAGCSAWYGWKGLVGLSGSTWEDITISLGRPLSGSGVGFALDSHSATKVDRRTLFYEDGWRCFLSFLRPASGRARRLWPFVKEGRGVAVPMRNSRI